jgi:hypothetical protein
VPGLEGASHGWITLFTASRFGQRPDRMRHLERYLRVDHAIVMVPTYNRIAGG